jgi:hypothetical protein
MKKKTTPIDSAVIVRVQEILHKRDAETERYIQEKKASYDDATYMRIGTVQALLGMELVRVGLAEDMFGL